MNHRSIVTHCTLHSLVSAAPSFIMALDFGWQLPSQITGMVAGVAAFSFCAVLLHLKGPISKIENFPIARLAMKWAKRVKMTQALIALLGVIGSSLESGPLRWALMVDLSAGIFASQCTAWLGFRNVLNEKSTNFAAMGPIERFSQAFFATFIEGWILAFGVALLFGLLWCGLRIAKLFVKGNISTPLR